MLLTGLRQRETWRLQFLDITVALHHFREWLLETKKLKLHSWPVIHLIACGPTIIYDQEMLGCGPWGRIWAMPRSLELVYPQGYAPAKMLPKRTNYIIVLYVPRVFTTDDLLQTVLHEYLHVGFHKGSSLTHPPYQEGVFVKRSIEMASEIRNLKGFANFSVIFDPSWLHLKKFGVYGLTSPLVSKRSFSLIGKQLRLVSLDVTELD